MLTQGQVRRALTYTGLAAGALGLVIALISLFGTIELSTRGQTRTVRIGLGAIQYHKSAMNYQMRFYNLQQPPPNPPPPTPIPGHARFQPANGIPWHILPSANQGTGILIPWWILFALGLYSAYRLLPDERTLGLCPKCRFDLSKTPPLESDPSRRLCPECGHTSPR